MPPPCAQDGSCNWDRLFAEPATPDYLSHSAPQLTYEYTMGNCSNGVIWCVNTAYLSFADYTTNPSPLSNILNLVQLSVICNAENRPSIPYARTGSSLLDGYLQISRNSESEFDSRSSTYTPTAEQFPSLATPPQHSPHPPSSEFNSSASATTQIQKPPSLPGQPSKSGNTA
ncbi:hypothetical protein BDV12DRAFT_90597 [Aspergillus spectabilis]